MIIGKVVSGDKKAAKYLNGKQYKNFIFEKLGFKPYSGTLNVEVNPEKRRIFLESIKEIRIEAFELDKEQFGGISIFKARLNGIEGAVVIPEKTEHSDNIIEFIAEFNLRKRLNLKDESEVMIVKNV